MIASKEKHFRKLTSDWIQNYDCIVSFMPKTRHCFPHWTLFNGVCTELEIKKEIISTCFFFFGLLFRCGLRASEPELALLFWDLTPFRNLKLLEEGPQLFDVLLDVDFAMFSTGTGWFLFDGSERGGGIRARADNSLWTYVLGKCMSSWTYVKKKIWEADSCIFTWK